MFLYENKPGGALFPITIIAYLLKNATVLGGSAWLKYYIREGWHVFKNTTDKKPDVYFPRAIS